MGRGRGWGQQVKIMNTYFRPLGLVYGADARALIAAERAGALGGLQHIGFTLLEVIERTGPRSVVAYGDVNHQDAVKKICTARPTFGGIGMDATRIMGIVNVTPDSFSDGGRLSDDAAAIAHGKLLIDQGADYLDVGGESTRPGSDVVSVDEELRRVLPVVSGLAKEAVVSADTRNAAVMTAALEQGAVIINDVSALGHDAASAAVVANAKCPVILMHAQGAPKTMQLNPRYDDVLLDVYDGLEARVVAAEVAGIARERICIDPGIGFGKTFAQNLQLMAGLSLFHGLGLPVLVGLSRKGFVGAVTGEMPALARVSGSVGGALAAAAMGVHILRVHDVKETRAALKMFNASLDPDSADI
jgi:dihydropteroate synthase